MKENDKKIPEENHFEKMMEHRMRMGRHMRMGHHCERPEQPHRVIVKGYMRPDKTSYYVVIPKEIRESFGLKGGEYFIIRAKPWANEIKLKLAKFAEEEQE